MILLAPEGEVIKIDQIRDLQKRLRYRPLEGGRRVCIIDMADSKKVVLYFNLDPPLREKLGLHKKQKLG